MIFSQEYNNNNNPFIIHTNDTLHPAYPTTTKTIKMVIGEVKFTQYIFSK
jgi:hypothetical protein